MISIRKQQFVKEYLRNNGNGVQAYLKVFKHRCSYKSATVGTTRYLKDKGIKEALKQAEKYLCNTSNITKQLQIDRLEKVISVLDLKRQSKEIAQIIELENNMLGFNSPVLTRNENINKNFNLTKDEQKEIDIIAKEQGWESKIFS